MGRSVNMHRSRRRARALSTVPAVAAAAVATLTGLSAVRANLWWDPGQTATTGNASGGTNYWDKTNPFWTVAGSNVDSVWTDGTTALFNVGSGTVTLNSSISAFAINFNVSGYTIVSSAANQLTLTSTSATNFGVNTSANVNVTLAGAFNVSTAANSNQTWYAATGSVINLTGSMSQTGNASNSGFVIAGPGLFNYTGTAFAPVKLVVNNGGTFNSSGAASIPGGSGNYTGIGDGTSGTLNVTGGTFATTATLFLGNTTTSATNTGIVNVTGGTLTATAAAINVGDGYNNNGDGTGLLNVSGGTLNTGSGATTIRLGNLASGNGTLNLLGGTLSTNASIVTGTYATTSVPGVTRGSAVNFGGGTLQALGTNLSIANTVQANVLTGGAIVDTNGFAVALAANLSSGIANDGGLTKLGTGLLTLSGSNTYTGRTNVSAGVLLATTTSSLPGYASPANVPVAAGAGLALRVGGTGGFATTDVDAYLAALPAGASVGIDTTNGNVTYATNVTGNVGLLKLGTNTLTLTGTNTYAGPTQIGNGAIAVANAAALGTGPIQLGTLGALTPGIQSADATARSIANPLTVLAGATTTFGDAAATTGPLTFTNAAPLAVPASATIGLTTNVSTTLAGGLSGTGVVINKAGPATLQVTGASPNLTSTSRVAINAGSLLVTNGNQLGSASITINGSATSNASSAGTLQLSGGVTLTNVINGLAARTDPLTTGATPHIQNLAGNNTVTSAITDNQPNGTGPVFQSDAGTLTFAGDFNNTSGSSYSRSYFFNGAGNFVTTGNFLAGANNTVTNTTNGLLIVKEGTGTMAVNGTASTFFGGAQILGGTLQANAPAALGSGLTTVNNSGGVLAGTGSTGGPVLVLAGGTITAGAGLTGTPGTLTTGAESWNASGGYTAKFASASGVAGSATGNDLLVMNGLSINATSDAPFVITATGTGVSLAPGQSILIATNSNTSSANPFTSAIGSTLVLSLSSTVTASTGLSLTTSQDAGGYELFLTAAATPEPTSLTLLGLGAIAPLARRGRRRSR